MLKHQNRTDRDGEKGRKQPDTKGQILYHSIYRLVPSEVARLRAGGSDGGGGTGQEEGSTVIKLRLPLGIAGQHCELRGVTAPDCCWLTPVSSAS